MRIAVGGLHVECCTFNPVKVTEKDFVIWRGDEMLSQPYFSVLNEYKAEYLPTFYARAVPGGPIARETYENFKADLLARMKASLPLDGVYLAMHGASFVDGMEDAEGDWLTAVRDVVGPDCVIAVSYDLHGNVSQKILDAIDIFSTYRTAPHIDVRETQLRSLKMLHRALTTGERPLIAWVKVPMLMGGERTSTFYEPAKSIYESLPELDALPGVWDASLQVGYRSADEPRATACSVFTGTDKAVIEAEATKLASRYWNVRHACVFPTRTGGVEEGVALAKTSATHPVILADSGDNPTAGGVGDRSNVLAEVLRQGLDGVIVAGITDPSATDKAYAAGVGARLDFEIGGTLDPSSGKIKVAAEVVLLSPTNEPLEREAVIRIGGVVVVLAARRRPYHNIADFKRLGLDPAGAKTLLVKSGYLSPELAPLANPNFMILSEGAVNQNHVTQGQRNRMLTPTYPWVQDLQWSPAVALSKRSLARLGA
ncbi:microcystin degradation protein MlrC [Devosia sp. D6-9]|nr:microcystin degradation protein MlrC [Devosia sp. D6-9]